VLTILALLAGLVVPKLIGQSAEAKVKDTVAQIALFKSALELFQSNCDRYPTTEEGLNALIQQPNDAPGWKKVLDSNHVPNDPWGNPYQYSCPGTHNADGYDIWSYGPDKQPGTADDITNWSN
jgi:general secretion pathway protein G